MVFCDLMTQSVQLIVAVPVTLMGQAVSLFVNFNYIYYLKMRGIT